MKLIIHYRGYTVFRNVEPGYKMRYTTRGPNGQLASDTQAGIKQLIREDSGLC